MTDQTLRAFRTSDEAFPVLFRVARERAGLTQDDVASQMARMGFDFHQQTVYKIERGKRKVSVGEAVALAEIVDTPVEELADMYPDSPESLANNVRRAGRDYAEQLFETAAHMAGLRVTRLVYIQAVREYARAPTAYFTYADGRTIPMDEIFESLARFSGISDYIVAWRELLESPEATASLAAFGWDPLEMDESEILL